MTSTHGYKHKAVGRIIGIEDLPDQEPFHTVNKQKHGTGEKTEKLGQTDGIGIIEPGFSNKMIMENKTGNG